MGLLFVMLMFGFEVVVLGKIRLFICVREQGSRIESVPLKRLIQLSAYRKRHWSFEDGWLVLEGF